MGHPFEIRPKIATAGSEAAYLGMRHSLIENDIRPTAVGRKRWLFLGHPHAGWRSAVIYSVLVSCRRRGINPETYLTDVLRRLPSLKITDIDALLPAHWQPPSADTG